MFWPIVKQVLLNASSLPCSPTKKSFAQKKIADIKIAETDYKRLIAELAIESIKYE